MNAFMATAALPDSVCGPVDFLAFFRLAAFWARDGMGERLLGVGFERKKPTHDGVGSFLTLLLGSCPHRQARDPQEEAVRPSYFYYVGVRASESGLSAGISAVKSCD